MNDNFSFAALEDNVPSLSLDYPGVLRAWAQLGGDIDLQDVSPGTSLSDSIEKWNGVSDTKFLDDELKMSSASSPIANSSSSGFGTGSQAPAPSCFCSYPCTHQKNCFGSMPERAAKSPLMGPIRTMHGRVPPLSTQDQDMLGSSIKPSMCSGMIPHIGSPHSYLPMEPFPMGKMDCLGISRPMVPVSSIPSMKQVAGSPFGGLTSMPSPQQPIKRCPDEPYTTQYIPVADVVASKAATSCNLKAAVSLPCPLQKAPSNVVPCSTESAGHNRAQVEGTQDKSKPRNTSPMQLRIQLEEMKGWKGRFRTRKQSLDRYMEKKARRLQTKKIRYELRKINADRRPRIKGRFAKKEQFEEYMKNQRAEIEC